MTKLTKIDVADVEPLLRKVCAEYPLGNAARAAEALLAKINPTPPTLVELLEKKVLQNGMSKSLYEEFGGMLDLARAQELRIKTLEAEKAVLETSKRAQGEEIIRLVEVAAKRWDALNKIKNTQFSTSFTEASEMRTIARNTLLGD